MSVKQSPLWFAALGLASAVGLGVAVGQDDSDETDPEESVEVVERANLTPQEQVDQAQRIIQRGEDLSRRVASQLDEARQERDIIRVTCINDKLTQINANLRTAQDRFTNLQDAVAAADTGRGNHEYTVMIVLNQKFVVLDREAIQCIGQDIYETGSTQVVTEIDPETPTDDPTAIVEPVVPIIPFVPPPASGTM